MDGLRLVAVGYGHPDATRLIETVQAEYVVRYGSHDKSPIDPRMFDPPHGTFLVGYVGEEAVATGAWRRRTDLEAFGTTVVAELKRMYVVPAARGAGHARPVLAELERTAAEAGTRHRPRDRPPPAGGDRVVHLLGLHPDPLVRPLPRVAAEPLLRQAARLTPRAAAP